MPSATIEQDTLCFRFPEVDSAAVLKVPLQRTLRIPNDDETYPLPTRLGAFPLRDVDQYAECIPSRWAERAATWLYVSLAATASICCGRTASDPGASAARGVSEVIVANRIDKVDLLFVIDNVAAPRSHSKQSIGGCAHLRARTQLLEQDGGPAGAAPAAAGEMKGSSSAASR